MREDTESSREPVGIVELGKRTDVLGLVGIDVACDTAVPTEGVDEADEVELELAVPAVNVLK